MKSVYLHEVSSAFTGCSAYVFGAFLLLFGGIYTLAYNLDLHVAEFQYVLQNMSFLFIFIIPGALLIFGFVRWMRRRKL